MVSEEMDLVTEQRMENGLNSQMVFQDESLQFNCGAPQGGPQRRVRDPVRKTRESAATATGFVGEKLFSVDGERYFGSQSAEFRRNIFDSSPGRQDRGDNRNWNGDRSAETPRSGNEGSDGDEDDEDDDDDEEDEDDEVDEGDGEVEGLVTVDDGNNKNNNSNGSVNSSSPEKMCSEKGDLQKHHSSSFGSSRGVLMKDGNVVHPVNSMRGNSSEQQHQQGRVNHYENAVTIAEPDMYYLLQGGPEGSNLGHKEIGGENVCGFSGRKDVSVIMDSGESLRAILSDPITGTLMDDAMILPCGHSFGSGGMQHVLRIKACYTCSQPVSEDSVAPNLSLRSAIQAFRHEEELHSHRVSKKRRERVEQEKSAYGDVSVYLSRGKGVQFPFTVTDRVIIKGNKRTPLRFVGREAVVTTQCLNGWYVVKTLDNAESVKLQYRSLAKVSDSPSLSAISNKATTPNWL